MEGETGKCSYVLFSLERTRVATPLDASLFFEAAAGNLGEAETYTFTLLWDELQDRMLNIVVSFFRAHS